MSAKTIRMLKPALMLGVVMTFAPLAANAVDVRRGIWIDIDTASAWTLTVVNLTEEPLALVSNDVTASKAQRPPYNGNTLDDEPAFPIAPFQNVTWKSNTATLAYPQPVWNGALTVRPQDADAKWAVTLHLAQDDFIWCGAESCQTAYGNWIYLTADLTGNPEWQDVSTGNISCSYPADYNSTYNVMTLSGTEYIAVLYAPYVNINAAPPVNATLVIRKRWAGETIHAPCLRYQDNNGDWE